MKVIWKFPLAVETFQKIDMPSGSEVLTAQTQNGDRAFIWALVNPGNEKEKRGFWILPTGGDIEKEHADLLGRYVGTFQVPPYVWHVFEHKYP